MTSVRPRKDYVLVAENKRETQTQSGIILDGQGLGESKTGTVLAVGPDVSAVNVGDKIFLMWNKAQVVTIEGNQRVMIKEEDIVGVLEE